jgi:hypothetical protein
MSAIWTEWFNKYDELKTEFNNLAAPFCSVIPPYYHRHIHRVLYVGKATRGCYEKKDLIVREMSLYQNVFVNAKN